MILGYAFVFAGFLFWVVGFYSVIVSKLFMPYTGHLILDWIKDDKYYCALIPSWLLSVAIVSWVNWVSMKYFRHT